MKPQRTSAKMPAALTTVLAAVGTCGLIPGCSSTVTNVDVDLVGFDPAHAEVLFVSGREWVTGSRGMNAGELSSHGKGRALVAFMDTNADGAFEPFAEPSTHCAAAPSGHKTCLLPSHRTIIHRIRNFWIGNPEVVGDDTVIAGAYFRPDGHLDGGVKLCTRSGKACAAVGLNPFVAPRENQELAMSPCQVREAIAEQPNDHAIGVTLSTGEQTERIDLPVPEPLGATFSLHEGKHTRVAVDTVQQSTQAIAWIEDESRGEVVWTSESSDSVVTRTTNHVEFQIPDRLRTLQGKHKIVVQVASIDDRGPIAVYSEERATAALPHPIPANTARPAP